MRSARAAEDILAAPDAIAAFANAVEQSEQRPGMLLVLPDLLTRSEVETLVELCKNVEFVDGGISAAGLARQGVKQNTEMLHKGPTAETIRDTVFGAIERNATFRTAALPQKIKDPLISRYVAGQHYGTHIDNPVMYRKGQPPLRLDLSMTIFLSAPEDYEGGELVLDTGFGEKAIKLPAGQAILYATTMPHRVAEVTSGTRLAAITWIQSLVADPARRKIIYDLAVVADFLRKEHPQSEPFVRLHNAYANLIRQWATN